MGLVDPATIRNRSDFARSLGVLRISAQKTIRDIAKSTGIPYGTVGGYFAGRHLPPLNPPTIFPAVLKAIGVTSEEDLLSWRAALERVRPTPGPTASDARPPYQGMESFQPEDTEWFFGREDLVETLLEELARNSLVAVVGPSGAGKSSLLRAGLMPRLPAVVLLTPTSDPVATLTELLQLPPSADGAPAVRPQTLIVDQFEELFTVCTDEDKRQAFAALLGVLVEGGVRVMFGLRADFYKHALRYPLLARCLQHSQVLVGPMTTEQLRRAITEPAHKAKVTIDDGLVELLLRDLAGMGGIAHEAGALPLLSHALLTTWERGNRRKMAVEGYKDSGGIYGAVAQTADAIFEGLDGPQQEQARALFLRMIRVGEDTADTRRRMPWSDLVAGADSSGMLYEFVQARLITADTHTVEITHDALLYSWPRLKQWIEADRARRLVGQQVGDAANAWEREGRDQAALYRGSRLVTAQDWLSSANAEEVTPAIRAFIEASVSHDRAEQRAARRKTRRLQQLLAVLSVAVVVAVFMAGYAFDQRGVAIRQRDMAISRQLAIEADKLKIKDIALARQLSLIAYQIFPTPEARSSLLSSYPAPVVTRAVGSPGVMQAIAVTTDHGLMATAGEDGTIQLWSLARPGHPTKLGTPLVGHTSIVYALAFTPDGHILASGSGDRTVRLWDVSDPDHVRMIKRLRSAATSTIYSLALSPDGHTLAAGSADGKVQLWILASLAGPRVLALPGSTVQAVAFSPDGTRLAAAGSAGTVQFWNTDGTALGRPLTGPAKTVFSLAFSPNGHMLAGGSADDSVWLWTVGGSARGAPLTGPTSFINGVAFSSDGATLAAASSDGKLWLWDTANRTVTTTLPHPGPVTAVVFLSDSLIATACTDGVARLWDLPGPLIHVRPGTIYGVAFSRNHDVLAITGLNNTARLWDIANPNHPYPLSPFLTNITQAPTRATGASALSPDLHTLAVGDNKGNVELWNVADPAHPSPRPDKLMGATTNIESLVFSPGGKLLVVTSNDGTALLWNFTDPLHPTRLGPPLTGFTNYAYAASLARDGHLLAVGSADQTVRIWDITNLDSPKLLGHALRADSSYVYAVAFSPDGRTLVTAGADDTVRLWNVIDPSHPTRLGPPLTGPTNEIFSIVFSPDGRTLAASAGDGSTWLWDVSRPGAPQFFATLTGPGDAMFFSDIDTQNAILATAGSDAAVWLWNTNPSQVSAQICATVGTPITEAEWRTYISDRPYTPPCGSPR